MKVRAYLVSLSIIVGSLMLFMTGPTESAPPPEEHTSYIFSTCSVFVSEFQPTKNFNSGSKRYYLDVGEDEFTYSYVSFVKFDLSSLPEDADIQTAEISLYLSADPENIPVKMYKIFETWVEDSVTWNSKPSYKDFSKTQGLVDTVTISTIGRQYWNATTLVEEWFNGSRINYGVAFESTGEYFHRFLSDDATYYTPLLAVYYYSSSGGGTQNPPEEGAKARERRTTSLLRVLAAE